MQTTPAQTGNYAAKLDKQNIEFLKELAHLIEQKGYKSIHVIPQLFVATGRAPDDKPVTMIIDSNTLKVFMFDNPLPGLLDGQKSEPEASVPKLH